MMIPYSMPAVTSPRTIVFTVTGKESNRS
jgi:hypothetical protein